MKTFKVTFENGRVQRLGAETWTRDDEVIYFRTGSATLELPAQGLFMIEELEEQQEPKMMARGTDSAPDQGDGMSLEAELDMH